MKKNILFVVIILVISLLTIACSLLGGNSKTPEPPYNGVFFMNDKDLVETFAWQGRPDYADDDYFPVSSDNQPFFIVWLPGLNLNYFLLIDTDFDEYAYNISSNDEGIYEVRPKNPLSAGDYCFYEGNPLASSIDLVFWCFKIEE